MATLPRGITAVSWKNSTKSKEKIVKYRVRVQKKVDGQQVKLDSLFDTLQQAVDELNNFKSKAGSYFLSALDKHKEEERKKVSELLIAPPISVYIKRYIAEKIDTRKKETQTQQRNTAVIKSFFKTILKTKIPNRHNSIMSPLLQGGGMLALIANNTLSQADERKEFGTFKVQEISYIEINDYIKERLKTVKKYLLQENFLSLRKYLMK